MEPCTDVLNSYTSNKIELLGILNATVAYQSQKCNATFHVVKNGVSLIGKNLIRDLKLNINGGTLSVNSNTVDSKPCKVTKDYPELFSSEFGLIKGYTHKIKIKPGAEPVQHKLCRLPLSVRESVSKELKLLQDEDIIEPFHEAAEWISPTVIVTKPNGTIRLCVDLRSVNQAIVVGTYPLPYIDELFIQLEGATYFSRLDLKSAFNQLEFEETSRPLTTFITHDGLFRYKRVCFGLASAPSCFQRMMSLIPGVTCFIDDII